MLIFRSEEHLEKWLKDWHMPPGAIISLEQCWQLAQAVYGPDRRAPDWRRKTVEETERNVSIGLRQLVTEFTELATPFR